VGCVGTLVAPLALAVLLNLLIASVRITEALDIRTDIPDAVVAAVFLALILSFSTIGSSLRHADLKT
jgi:hypothetical protein